MIVCVCRVVTEHAVREAVRAGADDLAEVGRRCGAGTSCGNCRRSLSELIEDEKRTGEAPQRPCKRAA